MGGDLAIEVNQLVGLGPGQAPLRRQRLQPTPLPRVRVREDVHIHAASLPTTLAFPGAGSLCIVSDEILTGEGVSLQIEAASVIARAGAWLIDAIVTGVALLLSVFVLALLDLGDSFDEALAAAFFIVMLTRGGLEATQRVDAATVARWESSPSACR